MHEFLDVPHSRPGNACIIATLYDAYSLLLLYSGSCSPDTYNSTIRPQMMAADPAFSGRWAPDQEAIGPLLKCIRKSTAPAVRQPITKAVKENIKIHMAVAERLVPEGKSLLRESGLDSSVPPTATQRRTYDGFFRVTRTSLCHREFAAQLLARLSQVRSDLRQHPLPVPCAWKQIGKTRNAPIDRFHRESLSTLDRLETYVRNSFQYEPAE